MRDGCWCENFYENKLYENHKQHLFCASDISGPFLFFCTANQKMGGAYIIVLFFLPSALALGWHDVCTFNETTTCHVWPRNPSPFHDPRNFLESMLCKNGCILKLQTKNASCTNIETCKSGNDPTSEFYTYLLSSPLIVHGPKTTIESLNPAELIRFEISSSGKDGQVCRAFEIRETDISLSNIAISFDSTCPNNETAVTTDHVPIIIRAGGTINLKRISSTSKVATVAVLSAAVVTLDLTVSQITMVAGHSSNRFPVMVFYVDYMSTFTCDEPTDILVVPRTKPNATCAMMDTSPFLMEDTSPDILAFTCPAVTVVEETNCEQKANLHLILILVLVAVCLILVLAVTCILCQKCKKNSHNFLGQGAAQHVNCPSS